MVKNRDKKEKCLKRPGTKWMTCEELRKLFDLNNLPLERDGYRETKKKNN